MASPITIERLQRAIKQRVSSVIQQELSDPRLGLVTVTEVKLSRDVTACVIRYSVLGSEGQRSKCAHALEAGTGYIRREVGRALKTRTVPTIEFEYDESIEGSVRISRLLREARGDVDEDASTADSESAPPTSAPDSIADEA